MKKIIRKIILHLSGLLGCLFICLVLLITGIIYLFSIKMGDWLMSSVIDSFSYSQKQDLNPAKVPKSNATFAPNYIFIPQDKILEFNQLLNRTDPDFYNEQQLKKALSIAINREDYEGAAEIKKIMQKKGIE